MKGTLRNKRRERGGQLVNQEMQRIGKEEVRAAVKRMENGKTAGLDAVMGMTGSEGFHPASCTASR